mgnify:CR=1 FL=1
MFDWIGDLIDAIAEAIREAFEFLGTQISNTIWNTMLRWFYETIYDAVADFFTMMGNMGADIFALDWVQATIKLFTLFGWSLFVAGLVVAVFDVAIEYQHGRADIKTTSINILKGFFACSLIGVVPVELYKFCISLQNTFSHDLSALFAGGQSIDLAGQSTSVLVGSFAVSSNITFSLFNILALIAFTGYGSSIRTSLASCPEFTTNGMLPKCWRRDSGKILLFKGGTSGAYNTGNVRTHGVHEKEVGRIFFLTYHLGYTRCHRYSGNTGSANERIDLTLGQPAHQLHRRGPWDLPPIHRSGLRLKRSRPAGSCRELRSF